MAKKTQRDELGSLLKHRLYTHEELRAELVAFREAADRDGVRSRAAVAIRNRIVAAHMRAAARFAARYVAPGMEAGDWIAYAAFGLINAVEAFDLAQEVHFQTFARYCMHHSVSEAYRNLRDLVRVPRSTFETLRNGTATDATKARIVGAIRGTMSMENPIKMGGRADTHDLTIADMLAHDGEGAEEQLARHQECMQAVDAIRDLTQAEREILIDRAEGMTLADIGQQRGVSKQRIGQIEAVALGRARDALRSVERKQRLKQA